MQWIAAIGTPLAIFAFVVTAQLEARAEENECWDDKCETFECRFNPVNDMMQACVKINPANCVHTPNEEDQCEHENGNPLCGDLLEGSLCSELESLMTGCGVNVQADVSESTKCPIE